MTQVMTLEQLAEQIRTGLVSLHTDSRKVMPGDAFVAVPGASMDGGDFICDALEKGAAYVVCRERSMPADAGDARFVLHEDPQTALGILAGVKFSTTELSFPVVGVTGTNGKTTVTYMLEHLFNAAGRRAGVIGTVSYRWPGTELEAKMTTPDCLKVHALLARMAVAGVDGVFMEVSSHALDQNRTAGVEYSGAILTNLTQDHLDYHGDMETYFQAKRRLFTSVPKAGKACVVNVDDPYGRRLLPELPNGIGFTLHDVKIEGCRILSGEVLSCTVEGLHLRMTLDGESWELVSPMVGYHNASNLLAVQGMGRALGLSAEDMRGLEGFNGVPGRLERIPNAKGVHAFVDYAHTPDALENVLTALRRVGFERIITVFGCGGDRDRRKRPLMGEAVCHHTDVAVLTSDNPRTEDPVAILEDVKPGLGGCTRVLIDPDRRKGIALAVAEARPGDCILVAGKGHEDYQIIGTQKFPFSDQAVLKELLG
ncbi:UDP-N-acetylmuramoyl-L-alanyl-D-glutamate--2,6-diaminopimelate ligase [Desulfovibrio subterraneus]|uniref:UDP-N-acetylmuramoyl-L-alanyl-D-glutamate--2,6-diaminopimelate ligase n=1 Tax=Desulfovibrio subterraneus TaxID=2718620 RepID=A0A7J0BIJ6_9BACT|nr:UDP-N-acetylmuramoyl-L-alanyl-D-glutamate--2,6-diaminopimelate ligase [Desulfovibrio subterraneus]GFM32914.1 UDP-N-acetylmuramoyl-L-alanyl-D-glutamate--2,6-diaminopimelate ligase [Desulfovibrio subterraneus]